MIPFWCTTYVWATHVPTFTAEGSGAETGKCLGKSILRAIKGMLSLPAGRRWPFSLVMVQRLAKPRLQPEKANLRQHLQHHRQRCCNYEQSWLGINRTQRSESRRRWTYCTIAPCMRVCLRLSLYLSLSLFFFGFWRGFSRRILH